MHEDICRRLERFSQQVEDGLSPRLMLLMPPRHGKSELASRMFPSWHLGRFPDHEFIACSYNVSLAMSFSRKVKEVMSDPVYQGIFETRLHPDFQAAEEWAISGHRGGYVAAGVGGGITGKGAHVLTIDDPIKNAEEAASADLREKLWEWYTSTAYTRLAPGGGVLIIQTWWHDDDLAGRVQQAMKDDPEADQFEVVKYPAIAEADEWLDMATQELIRVEHSEPALVNDEDPDQVAQVSSAAAKRAPDAPEGTACTLKLLRPKGGALHPERYNLRRLRQIKRTLPTQWWSALYQQNPVPDEGVYFTKDMFRQAAPPRLSESYVCVAFDFAIGEKQQNDYTVGTVSLLDSDDMMHFVDRVRFRSADADYIVRSMLALCRKWHNPSIQLGVEDGQIYRAISGPLKREMARQRLYPSLVLLKPITDKQARARTLQGRMQQGLVSFSDKAEWYDQMRTEMLRFPSGVHDDQVDSAAWNAIMVAERQPPRKAQATRVKSWKDRLVGAYEGSHMAA
ncbi:MAG: terminase family protein [Caldilineaceae bacterium]|nr:terminase family protein [Caldilineaceae bacterium]